jgi:class 3 adenylate cyclase
MFANAYIVFCRLMGLETAENPQIAYAFFELTRILNTQCKLIDDASVHTSVFGRFVVVRSGVVDAIRLAKAVVQDTDNLNVDVAIGIAAGPIQQIHDLAKTNWVGHSINLAARLASVASAPGSISVSHDVVEDCEDADGDLANCFGPELVGRVKATELKYHLIAAKESKKLAAAPRMNVKSENAHVVLYDIVKFSEQDPDRQADLAEGIRRRVEIALHSIGGLTPENLKSCYTSGGDGGGLVFRDGEQSGAIRAWTFAKSLRDRSRDIPIRIGIATGQIVFWEDAPPLGQGIFVAERASSFPQTGGICCHSTFWKRELPTADKLGWEESATPKAPDFFAVESNANRSRPEDQPLPFVNRPAFRACPDSLPDSGEHLVGRDEELARLNEAWERDDVKFVQIVAEGGVGKTQLVKKWRDRLLRSEGRGRIEQCFVWSFSSLASVDDFFQSALSHFEVTPERPTFNDSWAKAEALAKAVTRQRTLLILDSTESLQQFDGILDVSLGNLLDALRDENPGLCVLTTRWAVEKLNAIGEPLCRTIELKNLSAAAGADLLARFGVQGEASVLEQASESVENHALSIILLGTFLRNRHNGDATRFREVSLLGGQERYAERATRMIQSYEDWFGEQGDKGLAAISVLRLMGLFDRPATPDLLAELRKEPAISGLTDVLQAQKDWDLAWNRAIERLREARLLAEDRDNEGTLDAHPLIREFYARWLDQHEDVKRAANLRLYNCLITSAEDPECDEKATRQFLCHAIPYGCRAGLHRAVFREILGRRLLSNDPRVFYQHPDLTISLVFRMREFIQANAFTATKPEKQVLYLTSARDRARFQVWYSHCLAAYRGFIHPEVKPSFEHAVHLARGRTTLRRELFASLVGLFRCQLFLAEFDDAVKSVAEMDEGTRFNWFMRTIIPKDVQIRARNTVLQARAETDLYRGHFRSCSQIISSFLDSRDVEPASYFEMDPVVALHSIASWSNFYLGEVSKSVHNAESAVVRAESLEEGSAQQIHQSQGMAYYHSGILYYEMGDSGRVTEQSDNLARVADTLISPFWQGLSTCLKALSAKLQGDPEKAEHRLSTGIQIWGRMARRAMTRFWTILAELRLMLGRNDDAVSALETAEAFAKSGEHFYLSEMKRVRALVSPGLPSARLESLHPAFTQSLATAQEQNAIALELRTSCCYAEHLVRSGKSHLVGPLLEHVLQRYKDPFETADLRNAKTLLAHLSKKADIDSP